MMDQEEPGGTREDSYRSWDTLSKERAPGSYCRAGPYPSGPSSCPYSPECVEGVFSEVRRSRVLRSSHPAS